ncbi:MAG: glutathione peroxidase [Gammaproteobacteria bacterium]
MATLQDFSIRNLQDEPANQLNQLDGKVVLAVNVASKCGLTPQYEGLQKLQDELDGQGFSVLGFPCNQFGAQEPGSSEEIMVFCTTTYNVSFPLTQKIDVNGQGQHPVYAWLQEAFPGDIEWNFEKFLINKQGEVIKRYPPQTAPDDAVLLQDIADALEA